MMFKIDLQVLFLNERLSGFVFFLCESRTLWKDKQSGRERILHNLINRWTNVLTIILPVAFQKEEITEPECPAENGQISKLVLGEGFGGAENVGDLTADPVEDGVDLESMIAKTEARFSSKLTTSLFVGEEHSIANATMPFQDQCHLCGRKKDR